MANDANAYERAESTADVTTPNLYDAAAEKYMYEQERLRPLAIDKSAMILNKPGKQFYVYKETAFTVSALTEGTSTPITALDFNNVQLTVNWYGDAKQLSKEVVSEAFDFVVNDLNIGAAGAFATNRDTVIMTELLNTTTSAIYPTKSDGTKYTSSTIVSTAVLQYDQIVEARAYTRINAKLPIKTIIVHPNQEASLLKDDKFISADYSAGTAASTGIIGRIAGADVIESTAVQSVTENSVTVYVAIALADRAFMYAQKVNPVMEMDEETKRQRAITFHYYEAFGVKILYSERIVPLKSC